MCTPARHPIHCIIPPYMLEHLARQRDPELRFLAEAARRNLVASDRLRAQRAAACAMGHLLTSGGEGKKRTIYTAAGGRELPGTVVRREGDPPGTDVAVTEAYDGLGATYDFFREHCQRNSIDDCGLALDATVHYERDYDNAFWNGRQMVFGDGDGRLFHRFTISIDVIGHELTHGVTQYEAALEYRDQPGALNEHFSDVFGSLVKQYTRGQTAEQADWLIGEGLFTEKVNGRGIRSMKEPGSAYDDPALGKDPQPAHMKNLYRGPRDNGGVHINSGIPNRAFYLAATGLGGHAWEKAGRVWYLVLRDHLKRDAQFADAADLTVAVAEQELGAGAAKIVREAWTDVGVLRRAARSAAARKSQKSRGKKHADQGGSKRRVRRDSPGTRRRNG